MRMAYIRNKIGKGDSGYKIQIKEFGLNTSDLPPVTVPVVKLLFAAPLGQPLHFVEA